MAEGRDPGTLFDAIRDFSENASPLDFVLIAQHWQMFLTGVGYTVVLVAVSLVIGGAISLPLAVARANRTPIANQVIWAYVYLFRGTPLLVQLYIIYYGLGQFEFVRESFLWPVLREPLWCTLIAFVLNTAAYTTEIFRGAIEAVPYGEVEAAKAYGMSGRLPHDPDRAAKCLAAGAARVFQRGYLHAPRKRGREYGHHRGHPRGGPHPQFEVLPCLRGISRGGGALHVDRIRDHARIPDLERHWHAHLRPRES